MRILPSCTAVCLHQLDSNEMLEEKAKWELHKDDTYCFEQILESYKTTVTYLPSHKPSKKGKQDLLGTARYAKRNSYGFLHMDIPVSADQQRLTSTCTLDAV